MCWHVMLLVLLVSYPAGQTCRKLVTVSLTLDLSQLMSLRTV